MFDEKVSVLIVGGGIVGLSAALFLQKQNVPFILVERHSGTSIHPRARGVNIRTMEIYREIGLEDAVREAGASLAPVMGILNGPTLVSALEGFSAEQARKAMAGIIGVWGDVSSTAGTRVTQDMLEPVLLATARERGGDLRFYTEMLSFEQDSEGVTALITDRATGARRHIRADYMIAADGANSPVRQMLEAPVSGQGVLGHLLNVLFKTDLRDLTRGREFSLCRIENEQMKGLFASINLVDIWVCHIVYDPSKGDVREQLPPERVKELVRIALGLPDIEIEIKSILPWESAMRVVDNFQHGRVFFAGDAAHQMPPWGGQGANSGIADMHNLAWKLAAVFKGQATPALLASYNAERHPVDYLAADESAAAADESGLMAFGQTPKGPPPNFLERMPRMQGYYKYEQPSPAIIAEKEAAPSLDPLGLDGRPGTRAPHAWIEKQGQRLSTLDLFGTAFVLLTGAAGAAWCEAAQAVAQNLDIVLHSYRIGPDGDLLDPESKWQQKVGIETNGALLVRPDGYVAWRTHEFTDNAQRELEQVFARLLGHSSVPTQSSL